ncbi:MAG TPA: DNA repair protein RecN [Actinomycetota bacterium]|nr:DNA repair protein RecN [Actinomycetota bacterium]
MVQDLVVEGLGVIGRAEITFGPGSTALTGETGAGKTLIVTALALLTGGRADRGLVRTGAAEARVEGRWVVPPDHPAAELLVDAGVLDAAGTDDVEVVLSRTIGGAGKARINTRVVPVATLAEVGRHLVEIAGQHEHQRLTQPAQQRALLDAFAGAEALALADAVASDVRAAAAAERALAAASQDARERERTADLLRYEIAEIDAAALQPGEVEVLEAEVTRLEHAAALAEGIAEARSLLRGEGGAAEVLDGARRIVAKLAAHDPVLGDLAARLESIAYEVADAGEEVAARDVAPDPEALEAVRSRLATIRALARKYGDDDEAILEYREGAARRLAGLDDAGATAGHLAEEAERHRGAALDASARLTALRRRAARRLERQMEEMLATLALPGSVFRVALEPADLYEGGAETVTLLVSANPGDTPRPVSKVASGGELSRISLALRLLTSTDVPATTVFDEVDAGVGGEAAQAVGRALARLARESESQVLVVTHLPQVAAFADHQVVVAKDATGARLEAVAGDDRLEELSRMLAGMRHSERARDHARELLDLAQTKEGLGRPPSEKVGA